MTQSADNFIYLQTIEFMILLTRTHTIIPESAAHEKHNKRRGHNSKIAKYAIFTRSFSLLSRTSTGLIVANDKNSLSRSIVALKTGKSTPMYFSTLFFSLLQCFETLLRLFIHSSKRKAKSLEKNCDKFAWTNVGNPELASSQIALSRVETFTLGGSILFSFELLYPRPFVIAGFVEVMFLLSSCRVELSVFFKGSVLLPFDPCSRVLFTCGCAVSTESPSKQTKKKSALKMYMTVCSSCTKTNR